MPATNRIKEYIGGGVYHVYNRGVEKRNIFLDEQDYAVFLAFMKRYLSPPEKDFKHPLEGISFLPTRIRVLKNFFKEIELMSYCLMPNHYHFLLKQIDRNSMTEFIRSLSTSYAMYFNKKYDRVGGLFQGHYKAILVKEDAYLLHLSRYIHLNPKELMTGSDPVNYPYSSYGYYVGKKHASWVSTEFILSYFGKAEKSTPEEDYLSYQSFVDDYKQDEDVNLKTYMIDGYD